MKSFREYSRVFFTLFLSLTMIAGCCQTVLWMQEVGEYPYSKPHVKKYYGERYYGGDYYNSNIEQKNEASEDTLSYQDEYDDRRQIDYNYY